MPGMCAQRKRRSQRRDRSMSARVITVTPPPMVTDSGPTVTSHFPDLFVRVELLGFADAAPGSVVERPAQRGGTLGLGSGRD